MAEQITQVQERQTVQETQEIPEVTAVHRLKRLGGGRSATIWGPYAFAHSVAEQDQWSDDFKFNLKMQSRIAERLLHNEQDATYSLVECTDKRLSAHQQAKRIHPFQDRPIIQGLTLALKREAPGSHKSHRNRLANEYQVLQRLGRPEDMNVLVPTCYGFINEGHRTWQDILPKAPEGTRANAAILSEMIPSISNHAKAYMYQSQYSLGAEDFAPEELSGIFKIIHPYFGRRVNDARGLTSHVDGRQVHSVNRSNFVLSVDQMECNHLEFGREDYQKWAGAMGRGLAYVHWRARVDGYGVEFILGGARDRPCSTLGSHQIWMLDFDSCEPVAPMTDKGLRAIVAAFWRNRPQTPRPGSWVEADQRLWGIFKYEYRRIGKSIVCSYRERGESIMLLLERVDEVILEIEKSVVEKKD